MSENGFNRTLGLLSAASAAFAVLFGAFAFIMLLKSGNVGAAGGLAIVVVLASLSLAAGLSVAAFPEVDDE